MTNVNCLEGVRCPKCGNETRFNVQVVCWAEVTDDGMETFGDNEIEPYAPMQCCQCNHEATRDDFFIENQTDPGTPAKG